MQEPALIGLAESGQLTGKVLKLRLMVIVLGRGYPNVAASKMLIYLTSQAEGCSLELWNTHKGLLWKNFGRLVKEVEAQRRGGQESGDPSGQQRPEAPLAEARGRLSRNEASEDSNGSHQDRTASSSGAPSNSTTTNVRQPALKPITAIIDLIKSELDLPPTTSIPDTISMGMSSLGLAVVDTMTLKDKAVRVAHELGIPITEE